MSRRLPDRPTLWPLFFVCSLLGCSPGYGMNVSVTIPVEVQQAFSLDRPGMVVDGETVMGRLCSPTAGPLVFRSVSSQTGVCEKEKGNNDILEGDAYAFRPQDFEVTYRYDSDRAAAAVACGESGEVRAKGEASVEIESVSPSLSDQDKVATGTSSGYCSRGNYVVEITLALRSVK
jgi:hypothetical protein